MRLSIWLGDIRSDGFQIVYNDFPIPRALPAAPVVPSSIDPDVLAASPLSGRSPSQPRASDLPEDSTESGEPSSSQSSSATNKENTAPPSRSSTRPAVPAFNDAPTSHPRETSVPAQTLPIDLQNIYTSSTNILSKSFSHSPPYTIQRLAELVLHPRKHYRYLPPYLAALDRVVSVSSPLSVFPLPQLHLNTTNGGFLTNGDTPHSSTERDGLASDESLGGALLTPIPWLRRDNSLVDAALTGQSQEGELKSESEETVEGPNGAGRVETVSVTVNGISSVGGSSSSEEEKPAMTTEQTLRAEGAVTQGELLRQEQEAGVVPVAQTGSRRMITTGSAEIGRDHLLPSSDEMDRSEDHPHARGPDLIGMEDMGPQDGGLGISRPLDMEAAVGRSRSRSPQPPERPAEQPPEEVPQSEVKSEKEEELEESKDVEMTG